MAKVFTTSKAMNHFFWDALAAFHKATPFQGKTHAKTRYNQLLFKMEFNVNMFYIINNYLLLRFYLS